LQNQLPQTSPLLDGWDVVGAARQADGVGGAFYDWFTLPNGSLAVTAGLAHDLGINAAISAATLRAALRTQAGTDTTLDRLAAQANRALWASSAGESTASLISARVGQGAKIEIAATGRMHALMVRGEGHKAVKFSDALLGQDDDLTATLLTKKLGPGEALVAYGVCSAEASDAPLTEALDDEVAGAIAPALNLPAEHLAAIAEHVLESSVANWNHADRFVLVIKRRGA
jgi:sigma-B regulation protein RsbU (phosphoserine phosphatase)